MRGKDSPSVDEVMLDHLPITEPVFKTRYTDSNIGYESLATSVTSKNADHVGTHAHITYAHTYALSTLCLGVAVCPTLRTLRSRSLVTKLFGAPPLASLFLISLQRDESIEIFLIRSVVFLKRLRVASFVFVHPRSSCLGGATSCSFGDVAFGSLRTRLPSILSQ